jgi:hypothetical protein
MKIFFLLGWEIPIYNGMGWDRNDFLSLVLVDEIGNGYENGIWKEHTRGCTGIPNAGWE